MALTVNADLDWDRDERADALKQLRSARRRNRVANVDTFDAFYKAYISAIGSAIVIYGIAGLFGEKAIVGHQLDQVRNLAPVYLGLLVSVVLAIGLRSGGRGGPLAVERADVRHILMAPVAREDVLRGLALRSLRHSLFIGGAFGGVLGIIATRRLPGNPFEWVIGPMVYFAALGLGATGIALICSGFRIHRLVTDLLAFLFVVWAAVDAIFQISTSPFAWLSHVAVWPLHFDLLGVAGLVVMVVIAALGYVASPGWAIEVAERRSRLVGQLRFAATVQDVRTVMILQRQLAQEHLRVKPIIRLPRLKKAYTRNGFPRVSVFVRRCVHTWLRWSTFRILRLVAFAVLGGLAAFAAWQVALPLIAVSGILFWLVAIDLLEALAQEADHPDRLSGAAQPEGWNHIRLVIAPMFAQFFLVLIAMIGPAVLAANQGADTQLIVTLMTSTVVLATLLPIGGAALAVNRQASVASASMTPEINGLVTLWKVAMPPAVAILAFVPLAFAHRDYEVHRSVSHMAATMNLSWYVAFGIGLVAVYWIRGGKDWRERLQASTAEAQKTAAEKSAASTTKTDAKAKTGTQKPSSQKTSSKKSGKK